MEVKITPQLFFSESTGGVNFVTQDEEGNLGKLFGREQAIELGL